MEEQRVPIVNKRPSHSSRSHDSGQENVERPIMPQYKITARHSAMNESLDAADVQERPSKHEVLKTKKLKRKAPDEKSPKRRVQAIDPKKRRIIVQRVGREPISKPDIEGESLPLQRTEPIKGRGQRQGKKAQRKGKRGKEDSKKKGVGQRFSKSRKAVTSATVKPLQNVLMQLEGKLEAQKQDIGGEATTLTSGIVVGLMKAAIAVVKTAIFIISLVTTVISAIIGAISVTALVIIAVIVVIVVIVVVVIMSNPAISADADVIHALKHTCDMAISQQIDQEWALRFPLHTKITVSYNDSDANIANYHAAIAIARLLTDEEAIDPERLSSIVCLLNEMDYNGMDMTTLKVNIKQEEFPEIVCQSLFIEAGKIYNPAEVQDMSAMYREALDQIQGNRYDLHLSPPSLLTTWDLPFEGTEHVTKEYKETTSEKDEHWLTLNFARLTSIRSISRGLIVHLNAENTEMRIQYAAGAVLELNGSFQFDQTPVIGSLVSSGSRLFNVQGELSMKLVMPTGNVPKDKVKDPDTGHYITVPYLALDEHRSSVHPLTYVRYQIAKVKGQDGLRLRVIEEAKTYLGTPYVLGGSSKSGIDCSGLTMVAYNKITKGTPYATKLTHGSNSQDTLGQGRAVVFEHINSCWIRDKMSKEERERRMNEDLALLKPGDLLFFWGKKTYKTSPLNTHVGIYIGVNPVSGKHEFIHATSYAKKVVINEMKTYFHWPGRARRPIWD